MKRRPKRRPCPSCGLAFQKGARVLRIGPSGACYERVCQRCAALAVPVLASDAPAMCEVCSKNRASICKGCIGDYIEKASREHATVAGMVKAARGEK